MTRILTMALVVALAACGSRGGGAGGGSDAGGSGGGSGGARQGTINVGQACVTVGGAEYCTASAKAWFNTPPNPANPYCKTSTLVGCEIYECGPLADGGLPSPMPPESAGTITLSGTRVDGGLKVTFDAGGYDLFSLGNRIWASGDTIVASGTGATVSAFAGKTVNAPNEITVIAPACTSPGCNISRTADLTVSWTGNSSAQIRFVSSKSNAVAVILTCNFSSTPGIVGAAALAKLGRNDAGFANSVFMWPTNTNSFIAGDYRVSLTAFGTGSEGTFITSN